MIPLWKVEAILRPVGRGRTEPAKDRQAPRRGPRRRLPHRQRHAAELSRRGGGQPRRPAAEAALAAVPPVRRPGAASLPRLPRPPGRAAAAAAPPPLHGFPGGDESLRLKLSGPQQARYEEVCARRRALLASGGMAAGSGMHLARRLTTRPG